MYEDYLKRFDSLLPQADLGPAPVSAAGPVAPVAATHIPAPDNPTIRRVVNEARMDFHLVRDRHTRLLTQVNGELAQVECGPLVAVAISNAARQPGPFADFLIDIGLNPFGDWNMLYYASDKASADLMDAALFTPEVQGQFDIEFSAVIEQSRQGWLKFHGHPDAGDEATVRTCRDTLRVMLAKHGETVKSTVYGNKANRWQNLFPKQQS